MTKEEHTYTFECWDAEPEEGELKTFESVGIPYDDGGGYVDIKSAKECPYCGRHHWK